MFKLARSKPFTSALRAGKVKFPKLESSLKLEELMEAISYSY